MTFPCLLPSFSSHSANTGQFRIFPYQSYFLLSRGYFLLHAMLRSDPGYRAGDNEDENTIFKAFAPGRVLQCLQAMGNCCPPARGLLMPTSRVLMVKNSQACSYNAIFQGLCADSLLGKWFQVARDRGQWKWKRERMKDNTKMYHQGSHGWRRLMLNPVRPRGFYERLRMIFQDDKTEASLHRLSSPSRQGSPVVFMYLRVSHTLAWGTPRDTKWELRGTVWAEALPNAPV